MQPKPRKLVWEIAEEAQFIIEMVGTKTEQELRTQRPIRYVLERALQNCGEAMSQLDRIDPGIAARFTDHRNLIGLRHRLVHSYSEIDPNLLIEYAIRLVPQLLREAETVLEDFK